MPCKVCGADVKVFDEKGATDNWRWYICPVCGWSKKVRPLVPKRGDTKI
jgi:hypothetical protein